MRKFNFSKIINKISKMTNGSMINYFFDGEISFEFYGSEYVVEQLKDLLSEQKNFRVYKYKMNFSGLAIELDSQLLSSNFYLIHRINISEEEFTKLIKLNILLNELCNSISNFTKNEVVKKVFRGGNKIDSNSDDRLPTKYKEIFNTYKQSLYEILAEVLRIIIEIIVTNDENKNAKYKRTSNNELAKEANSIKSIIKDELDKMKG